MLNWDLKWAREWAKLSQVEAAALMGVHKQTWNRWESGSHPTPAGTLKRLKERTAMPAEVEQARLRYDRDGYPFGYSRKRFEDEGRAAAQGAGAEYYDDAAVDAAEEAALREVEGGEYEDRARERFRLLLSKLFTTEADITRELALYDAETERSEGRAAPPVAAAERQCAP